MTNPKSLVIRSQKLCLAPSFEYLPRPEGVTRGEGITRGGGGIFLLMKRKRRSFREVNLKTHVCTMRCECKSVSKCAFEPVGWVAKSPIRDPSALQEGIYVRVWMGGTVGCGLRV